jgi:hypothetical protein
MQSIHALVREQEQNFISGTTTLSKYVTHSLHETIEKIDAYLNSQHISGKTDSLGREKPFFNIVTAASNIWFRATDLDRKDIRIKATRQRDVAAAFIATVHLQEWMNRTNFGAFLNQWGLTMARYGSAVTKFVTKDGVLYPKVIPWNRMICDAVDFDNNPKIEKLYFTPSQLLREPGYDKTQVKALIAAQAPRKTLDGEQQDNISGYIEVYEVHGELPLSYLTAKDKDDDKYRQQMHAVSYVEDKDGEYLDFTLYSGKEKDDPYRKDDLIPIDGRTLAIGAVEHLFEAQWMENHTVKAIKDQLDLASKIIFQTADGSFAGRNVLSAIETGDILIHKDGAPLEQANNSSHDIASLQSFGEQWRVLAQDITSTPDAIRGNTQPSGTAYHLQQLLTTESHSLFEIMTENKGISLEGMLRVKIIPYLKTKMDTNEEIAATLDSAGIAELDAMYIPGEAARRGKNRAIDAMLKYDQIPAPLDLAGEQRTIKQELAQHGNKRFIVPSLTDKLLTWAKFFKDLEWEVAVEITDENSDKQAVLTTLASVFQTLVSNPLGPRILEDDNARLVFNHILEETGTLSPLQLAKPSPAPQPQLQSQPQGGGDALQALAPTT